MFPQHLAASSCPIWLWDLLHGNFTQALTSGRRHCTSQASGGHATPQAAGECKHTVGKPANPFGTSPEPRIKLQDGSKNSL